MVSAGALERFAGCPVKWLVEDVLKPEKLEPDPEQMVRGSYAHRVLELTYRRLRERTGRAGVYARQPGGGRADPGRGAGGVQGEFRLSPNQVRVRAAVRRLEFDLLRYLRHESGRDGLFEPEHLELRFGFADCEHPAVEIEGGTAGARGDRPRGRAGRLGPRARLQERQGRLLQGGGLGAQEPLPGRALHDGGGGLLGLRAAGGVYVPLGGTERRPRGMVAEEAPRSWAATSSTTT